MAPPPGFEIHQYRRRRPELEAHHASSVGGRDELHELSRKRFRIFPQQCHPPRPASAQGATPAALGVVERAPVRFRTRQRGADDADAGRRLRGSGELPQTGRGRPLVNSTRPFPSIVTGTCRVDDLLDRTPAAAARWNAGETAVDLTHPLRFMRSRDHSAHVAIGEDVAGANDHGLRPSMAM